MKTPLNDFYKDVLDFANLHVDSNGYIRSNGGEKSIITVKNRLLVVPLREHMRTLTQDKEIFHPLAENTLTRLSEALETFIYRLNGNLNTRFAEVIWELKEFCCSPKRQLGLTPDQLKIIRSIQAEEESKEDSAFEKFLAQQIRENPSGSFLNITLARGAPFKGQKKSRVGFVSFPLYKKIKEDLLKPRSETVFGGISKKKLELILQLYEAIFPGLDIPEEYGYGFDSGIAPWFTTLMHTAAGVADSLNFITDSFGKEFASESLLPLNLKWKATFENQTELQKLSKTVPNTELDPVSESSDNRQKRTIQEPVAKPTATVPFVGAGRTQDIYRNQQQTQTNEFARPDPKLKGRSRVPFEQWRSQSSSPSPMSAQGTAMEAIRIYNEGYSNFYNAHIQNYGMPPGNMPLPSQIPPNQPAPTYPGAPPLPLIPGVNAPVQQQMFMQPQTQWVQTQQGMMQMPMNMQQQFQQPQQQTFQNSWQQQQPQQVWQNNQQSFNNSSNTHTGTIIPGAL